MYAALLGLRRSDNPISVVYCDTGVEIPVIAGFVRRTLRGLAAEAKAADLPIRVHIARPRIEDTYFVKVIGRGYPPPTNKFRWCTDRLRIDPVQRVIANLSDAGALVLLGVRRGESPERDRTLEGVGTDQPFMLRQIGSKDTPVFAPMLNYSTEEVWETLIYMKRPQSLDARGLWRLYGQAAGEECPIVRDPQGSPCAKGRFGCWTCTVVRKDHGVAGLVEAGYSHMAPLLEFRNWLQEMRDQPEHRCPRRRNGAPGPGPLTLDARRLILRRLRSAEKKSGLKLIRESEIRLIRELWAEDRHSSSYRRIEGK